MKRHATVAQMTAALAMVPTVGVAKAARRWHVSRQALYAHIRRDKDAAGLVTVNSPNAHDIQTASPECDRIENAENAMIRERASTLVKEIDRLRNTKHDLLNIVGALTLENYQLKSAIGNAASST